MTTNRFAESLFVSIILIILSVSPAWALVGDSEEAFGLDGSLRTIEGVIDNYDFEPFFDENNSSEFFSQTILRLTAEGHPQEWLAYEIHALQSLDLSQKTSSTGTATFSLTSRKTRYRMLDDSQDWIDEDNKRASFWMDRFNAKFSLPWADITVGRQAITFGKAYFWNPLDVFLPFDPRQFDQDYKAGVDALRLDLPTGDFSGFNLIGSLGRQIDISGDYAGSGGDFDSSWYGSAVMGRAFTNFSEWDLALQGGKIYGGYQLGGGAVGEIKTVEIRLEGAYFWADESRRLPFPHDGDLVEDHFTGVFGLGRRFENSFTIEAEYLYNGSGDPDNLDAALIRYANGTRFQLGRQFTGVMVGYEFLPIVTGNLAGIHSWSDSSSQLLPGITISLNDETDLLLGALINFGKRPSGGSALAPDLQSEFGAYPDVYFLELKVYF